MKNKLTIEIEYHEGALDKAIEFIHGRTDFIDQVKQDFLPEDKTITIDLTKVQDEDRRKYLMNNFVCGLIVVQEEAVKYANQTN